jgi:hypothetical protein
MVIAVIVLMMIGACWLLQTRQTPTPPVPGQSGALPQALAEEIKRHEQAYYLLGIKDGMEFWRLTGVAPDTPELRNALWARHQASPNPLTPADAKAMLQRFPC